MFILLLFLLGSVFVYLKWRSKYFEGPPRFPGYWPLLGHSHIVMFLGDTTELWRFVKNACGTCTNLGGVISFSLGTWTIYGISDPDDCLTIANTCLQKDKVYDMAKPWLGEGLVTGSVPVWKVHRKLLYRAFSQPVVDEYLGVFNSQSKKMVKAMEKEVGGKPFDHSHYFEANSLETICLTAMGLNDDENAILKNEQYMFSMNELCNTLVQRVQHVWMHSNFIFSWSKLKRKQDRLIKVLHDMSHSVLAKKKAKLIAQPSDKLSKFTDEGKFNSFMDILLQDNALTDDEIREEVDTMIAAGFDTSSNLLIYITLMLGARPAVQNRVYKELQEVFGDSERDVEKQDLAKLVYLEAVIKETLRFYPIIPMVGRQLDRDVKLKNYTLPSGSSCFLLLYGMHRHPVWGPDAEQFKPERWLSPDTLPDNPNAFAGFSLGRRTCIGQKFAMMSMKTTIAHVLRNYTIKGDDTNLQLKFDIILRAASGHHITIARRSKQNASMDLAYQY